LGTFSCFIFLKITILTGVVVYFGFLLCLVMNIFHISIGHLYIFFEKCLFGSFAHFQGGLFALLLRSSLSSLFILEFNPYQPYCFKMFSPVLWIVFLFCWLLPFLWIISLA
jgi:hypothetical protein